MMFQEHSTDDALIFDYIKTVDALTLASRHFTHQFYSPNEKASLLLHVLLNFVFIQK